MALTDLAVVPGHWDRVSRELSRAYAQTDLAFLYHTCYDSHICLHHFTGPILLSAVAFGVPEHLEYHMPCNVLMHASQAKVRVHKEVSRCVLLQEAWDSAAAELSSRFKLAEQHQQELPAARPEAAQRPCRPCEEPEAMLDTARAGISQCSNMAVSNISAQGNSACGGRSLHDHDPWRQQHRLQQLHDLTTSVQVGALQYSSTGASRLIICNKLNFRNQGPDVLPELLTHSANTRELI